MEAFVERNFQTLLTDKTLCDVAIEVGLHHNQKRTFHCVGALIGVHSEILRDKICGLPECTKPSIRIPKPSISSSKSLELRESKEEEIIELSTDSDFVAEDNEIRGLEEDFPDLETNTKGHNQFQSHSQCLKWISLDHISCDTMEYLRLLFYGMNPLISTQNVVGIYHVSEQYGLSVLKEAALSYIECISIEEFPRQFLSLLLDSQRYELYSMINELILKLPDHNLQPFFSSLINDERFGCLSDAVVEMLLFQSSSFKNMPPEMLFFAVLKWAQSHDLQSHLQSNPLQGQSPKSSSKSIDSPHSSVSMDSEARTPRKEMNQIFKVSASIDFDDDSLFECNPCDHHWSAQSLSKLQDFLKYFDFASMKHAFFREYVQSVEGLLSKEEIIKIQGQHCDAMIASMRSMQNIIDLQRYDTEMKVEHGINGLNGINGHGNGGGGGSSRPSSNVNINVNVQYPLYKMDELCHHSQAMDLDLVHCINYRKMEMVHDHPEQRQYPAKRSYQYPALKLFIESNLKSLLCDSSNEEREGVMDGIDGVHPVITNTDNMIDDESVCRHHDEDVEDEMKAVLCDTAGNLPVGTNGGDTVPIQSKVGSNSNHNSTDGHFYDVVFEVGGGKEHFHGIRALFAIHSPVFRSMLYGQMLEASSHKVILHDMTPSIFKCLQWCLYGFRPEISYQNVIGLYYHSDKFMIDPLKECCMEYVHNIAVCEQIDHFLHILGELMKYNLCASWKCVIAELMKSIDIGQCTNFLLTISKLHECDLHQSWKVTIGTMRITQSVTCQQILTEDAFLKLPTEIVHEFIKIFRTEYPHLIHQHSLWTAVISWANAQRQDLKEFEEEESDELQLESDDDDVVLEWNSRTKRNHKGIKGLVRDFVKYFDFKEMDAEFVREYVEPVNVLDFEQCIAVYRAHSVELSALQKRVHQLEVENKRQFEAYQVSQRNLAGSEREMLHLRKEHKKQISQYERHLSANSMSMNNPYLHHNHRHSTIASPTLRPSYPVVSTSSVVQQGSAPISHHQQNVRFEWYSREYLTVSKNGRQIETKRDDCHWLLSYLNVKCRDGVHIISVKAHECEHGYAAIGIVTAKDIAHIAGKNFPDDALGRQYYYQVGQYSWSKGEVITVLVDCISSRIVFKKNGQVVLKKDIEKNKAYWPVLQTCGCKGHRYEILEYKTIRSTVSKH